MLSARNIADATVGSIADMTVFSFHPVKHITTGEGGMVTTNNPQFAETLRRFRNHGISSDARQRQSAGQWHYEMVLLGFNYRLPDIVCALGIEQLKRLECESCTAAGNRGALYGCVPRDCRGDRADGAAGRESSVALISDSAGSGKADARTARRSSARCARRISA